MKRVVAMEVRVRPFLLVDMHGVDMHGGDSSIPFSQCPAVDPSQDSSHRPVTPPGDGGAVTIFSWTGGPPVPDLSQNTSWHAVNKAVGANLQPNMGHSPITCTQAKAEFQQAYLA